MPISCRGKGTSHSRLAAGSRAEIVEVCWLGHLPWLIKSRILGSSLSSMRALACPVCRKSTYIAAISRGTHSLGCLVIVLHVGQVQILATSERGSGVQSKPNQDRPTMCRPARVEGCKTNGATGRVNQNPGKWGVERTISVLSG